MTYDPSLFKGTAQFYSQFRLGYPTELYDEIFKHLAVGEPRLLDMGCGPATITAAIIDRCSEAVCVDPDPEMLTEGKSVVGKNSKVSFINSTAENLNFNQLGEFDLITFGSSLHWMNSAVLMPQVADTLNSGGIIAILYSKSAGMNLWQPDVPNTWQGQITAVIQKYLGRERRAGSEQFQRTRNTDTFEESLIKTPGLSLFLEINVPYIERGHQKLCLDSCIRLHFVAKIILATRLKILKLILNQS